MNDTEKRGAGLESGNGIRSMIRDFLHQAMDKGVADAVLVPIRVPAGDSYAWILINDASLIDDANPTAPVMPVQGAKALKSFTRKGNGTVNVIAVMRPCEIRAAIELSKLNQVHLDNTILVSYDCFGALPHQEYIGDPESGEKQFDSIIENRKTDDVQVKPECRICIDFSLVDSDIHFGFMGQKDGSALLIPKSEKGEAALESMGIQCIEDISGWMQTVSKLRVQRENERKKILDDTGAGLQGLDGLQATFADCIGCHNCQSACPICYCRQCYFDSEMAKQDPGAILDTAIRRGGVAFPKDRIMFHIGRMAHMSLSCVSCGQCSDACPVSIPVGRIFSYMSDLTQPTFEYTAGRNDGEPLPLRQFREDEGEKVHELVKGAGEEEKPHE